MDEVLAASWARASDSESRAPPQLGHLSSGLFGWLAWVSELGLGPSGCGGLDGLFIGFMPWILEPESPKSAVVRGLPGPRQGGVTMASLGFFKAFRLAWRAEHQGLIYPTGGPSPVVLNFGEFELVGKPRRSRARRGSIGGEW